MMEYKMTNDNAVSDELFSRYLKSLVDRFFKILPIREEKGTMPVSYINSLKIELLGFGSLAKKLDYDPNYTAIISVLQYLNDNPDCPLPDLRREIFKAISIVNKLRERYMESEPQ